MVRDRPGRQSVGVSAVSATALLLHVQPDASSANGHCQELAVELGWLCARNHGHGVISEAEGRSGWIKPPGLNPAHYRHVSVK